MRGFVFKTHLHCVGSRVSSSTGRRYESQPNGDDVERALHPTRERVVRTALPAGGFNVEKRFGFFELPSVPVIVPTEHLRLSA